MDLAGEEAAVSTNVYMLDLVRFEPQPGGFADRGLVIPANGLYSPNSRSVPASTFNILSADAAVTTGIAGDVTLLDRSYISPGQVVASASNPGGQIGVVTGVTTALDLIQLGDPTAVMIQGVSPSGLRRVRALSLGDYVVSGPWLGRVVEVSLDVDVLFDDGAVCKVTDAESKKLLSAETHGSYRPQTNTLLYPGERVTGDPHAVLKASRWLNGHWKPSREVGTVCKVEMAGVLVYWITSALAGGTDQQLQESAPPAAYQSPDSLTFFCPASDCTWAVADRCFLAHGSPETQDDASCSGSPPPDDDGDSVNLFERPPPDHAAPSASSEQELDDELWSATDDDGHAHTNTMLVDTKRQAEERPSSSSSYRRQLRKYLFVPHRRTRRGDPRHTEPLELPMTVSDTRTAVDVLWQDGTLQHGAPSTSVVPFEIMNEHEFFPGQYVVDNAPALDGSVAGSNRRLGIVRSLNCTDQTVHVSWFKAAAASCLEVECCDDTVSAYDLGIDRDHCAFYGDVVIRPLPLGPTDGAGCCTASQVQQQAPADLSWVGRVVDLPDGRVQVKWGDGTMSTVLPHEIIVVNDDHYTELQAEMGDWVEDDGAQDLDAANTDDRDPPNPADRNMEGGADDFPSEFGRASAWKWGLGGAFRLVTLLAAKTLAQSKRYLARWSMSSISGLPVAGENAQVPVSGSGKDSPNNSVAEVTSCDATAGSHGSDPEEEEKPTVATGGDDDPFRFPRFDILVQSPSDHHYLETMDSQGGGSRKTWVKTVQNEWKILLNDLPDTIYVRAFEDRMHLLRVVIVGASGTPYHDGLFFFDLHLPPSYPTVPPQVYYHSFGLRLNPNLYSSGTVCLSLLNTFGGEGSEVWSPATSTLLQVVVSIQGLVLNSQPYYNEAGYEDLVGTPEGRRNALPYSEKAYLLTLQTMLHLLRRPPLGFEEFIKDHFRRRGRFILRACEAYLQGCIVGTLSSDACSSDDCSERPCSVGLRLALSNVVPSLMDAIREIEAEE